MPKQPPPSALADKFMLRLPDGMRDRIADIAKRNNRSMNAEIIATLEENYPPEPLLDDLVDYARELAKVYREEPSNSILKQLLSVLNDISDDIPEMSAWKEQRKNQRGRTQLRQGRGPKA